MGSDPGCNAIESPQAYAHTAVVNRARAWGRRRKRSTVRAHEPTHSGGVDADAIAVRRALADLSTVEREVLVLRFYADLKVDDIAADLGLPVGTVKSHIHRGLTRLHRELS